MIRVKFQLPAIYPITDRRLSNLSHYGQIKRLIAGGAAFVQIREKELLPGDWVDDARQAVEYAHRKGVIVVINDRVDVALAVHADGVHLGQDDLPPQEARRLLGEAAIIGYSTHNSEQFSRALELPIDYAAFGPVFGTFTKKDADTTVGLDLLKEASRSKGNKPLAAIGGIDGSNVAQVLEAGADSAAMISYLVSDGSEIEKRMSDAIRLYNIL